MSALEKLSGLDTQLAEIKAAHQAEIQTMKDALLAAELKAEMSASQLKVSRANEARWMRTATQLITQFDTVEKIFAEAKEMAVQVAEQQAAAEKVLEDKDPPPTFLSRPRADLPSVSPIQKAVGMANPIPSGNQVVSKIVQSR